MTDNIIRSTDDRRVGVSGIRHAYRALSDDEKRTVDVIKDMGQQLWDVCDAQSQHATRSGQARSYALAKTKIEEAVMWAVHGVTSPEPEQRAESDA